MAGKNKENNNTPLVSIIMGSDSDLHIMKDAAIILEEFKIDYEINVISAHRTPKKAYDFAQKLVDRGIKVVIAGAGAAAHLPGVIAALTPLPVIGVPINSSALNGLDSLLSIVQMPSGIPVATVGINSAKNAGILAASIIGSSNQETLKRVLAYKKRMERSIEEKSEKFEKGNWKELLK